MADKFNAVMIDTEFLDTRATAALLAVALVPMNTETFAIGEGLKLNVDVDECIRRGMTVSGDTIRFWTKQNAKAFDDAFDVDARYRHTLELLLVKTSNFLTNIAPENRLEVWACGRLDLSILAYGYDLLHKKMPWAYYMERDFRTLREHYPQVAAPSPTTHLCLEDATRQAQHLMAILNHRRAQPIGSKQPPKKSLKDFDDDEL